jgi:hypothetical protein
LVVVGMPTVVGGEMEVIGFSRSGMGMQLLAGTSGDLQRER